MSSYPHLFIDLFVSNEYFMVFAKYSMFLMFPWYFGILPMVLIGGLWRKFIIIWGWLFIFLSVFVLQLGFLGEIEIIFWLAIFWSGFGIKKQYQLDVLYDDKCNLCDKTIKFITFIDIFGLVKLRPVSKNNDFLNVIGLDYKLALTDLYGYQTTNRKLYSGYNFYLHLSKTLIFLFLYIQFYFYVNI